MRRLSQAGFKNEFVRSAILPDWWDDSSADDPGLLPDLEIRVARFLRRSITEIRNPEVRLAAPSYAGAQLRRVRDIDHDRLGPAIHTALQVASAAIRSLRNPAQPISTPPLEALQWRQEIQQAAPTVTLDGLLGDLWGRGIPVIPLDTLPVPRFQGLACVVEGRPVILLGHKNDEPGRVAFVVAHEAGHIAMGDCAPNQPVVDEEEEVADTTDMERNADRFATRLLVGGDTPPQINGSNFKQLAQQAALHESRTGADASCIIFTWARLNGDYAKASMAVQALYRGSGARAKLRQHFDLHVDLDTATESDRCLLRCVYGDPELNETAD